MRRFVLSLLVMCCAFPMRAQATTVARCSATILPAEARGYDPASEVRLQGRVEEVRAAGGRGFPALRLRARFGTVLVQLGARGAELAPGEAVEVVASKQQDGAGQYFVARQIHKAGRTLTLRTDLGVPVA